MRLAVLPAPTFANVVPMHQSADEFADIPEAMRDVRRWLGWRMVGTRKIPYYVTGKPRSGTLDTPEDIAQLASFDDAVRAYRAGGYSGIGFALGPDGTGLCWQGIDLDNVDANGIAHLVAHLPGYVELSPSGKGFHAYGYGPAFPTLGSNGSGIEAYSSKRFFTVTGSACDTGGDLECLAESVMEFFAQWHMAGASKADDPPPADSAPVPEIGHRAHRAHSTHSIPASQHHSIPCKEEGGSSAEGERPDAEADWLGLPANCKPQASGVRNRVLFNLARHLKTKYPASVANDHLPLLKKWFAVHLQIIQTKDWDSSWNDFRAAFRRVRFTDNETPLHLVFQEVDMQAPIPPELERLGYGQKGFITFQLCSLLSRNTGGTFFVSHRTLAPLLGYDSPQSAGNLLNNLVEDGCLEVIEQGRLMKGGKHKASTYRFIGLPKEQQHD